MTPMRYGSLKERLKPFRQTQRNFQAWLTWCLLFLSLSLGAPTTSFSPDAYLKHVKCLASDELQGRGNGSKELEKAGEYIAGQFKAGGLKPGAPDGSWFQSFEIVTGLTVGQGNHFAIHAG